MPFYIYVIATNIPPGRKQAPNPTYSLIAERGKPVLLLTLCQESEPQGKPAAVRAWEVGKSECCTVMV